MTLATRSRVLSFPSVAEYTRSVPLGERRALIASALGLRVTKAISEDRAQAWVARVLEARADYTHAFGSQASLGVAWYTHLEEGSARRYFEGAAASDACVRRHLPGFQRALLELVGTILGVTVTPRPGHAGPGIHVFEPNGPCARLGGEVHFDTEGLPGASLGRDGRAALRPAYTAVLALSRVASGGGLRLWDLPYEGHEEPSLAHLAEPTTIAYSPGDLVVFESYRLHQIEPFGGETPRVSATCHVAQLSGRWDAWF